MNEQVKEALKKNLVSWGDMFGGKGAEMMFSHLIEWLEEIEQKIKFVDQLHIDYWVDHQKAHIDRYFNILFKEIELRKEQHRKLEERVKKLEELCKSNRPFSPLD